MLRPRAGEESRDVKTEDPFEECRMSYIDKA